MNNILFEIMSRYIILPNVNYLRADGVDLGVDIYVPKDNFDISGVDDFKKIKNIPTVVYFHGGGWVVGSKEESTLKLLPYLSKGWAVVNVGYRKASEALAPSAVEDSRCAVWWVKRNAEKYGFNSDQIILTGHSAGGHLALLAGILPASAGFDRRCPNLTGINSTLNRANATLPELEVAAIINWAGITDVGDLIKEPNMRYYALMWLGSIQNPELIAKRVSPLTYIRKGLPPILTLHGDKDVVVPYGHAVRLHDALEEMQTPNQLHTIKGKEHFDFSSDEWAESYSVVDAFISKYVM